MTVDPKAIPSVSAPEANPPQAFRQQAENGGAAAGFMAARTRAGRQRWLLRIRALLFVTVCATFGVLLLILPWTQHWTDNPLLLGSPELRHIVSSGFVRGFASGLGMLDLWLGFWEAIHYHENPKGSGQ